MKRNRFGNRMNSDNGAARDSTPCEPCVIKTRRSGFRVCLLGVVALVGALRVNQGLAQASAIDQIISPADPRIELFGRVDDSKRDRPRISYPGTGLKFRFRGGAAKLEVDSDSAKGALMIVADHGVAQLALLKKGENEVVLASSKDDEPHEIEVYKRTETSFGIMTIKNLILSRNAELLAPPPLPKRKLLFIGDSVTCGGGVQRNEQCKEDPERPANDGYDTFGMVLARRLDADVEQVCFGGRGLERDYRGLGKADGVLNAPQFLDLAIPSDDPKARATWDPSRWQPDAIVVSLGTNDFNLQKTKPLDEKSWVMTYVDFARSIRRDYPHATILLTEGAMVTDPLLRTMVQETVAALQDPAVKYMQSTHYKGNACNGHPTQAQHMHMADDMEPVIRQEMRW